MQRKGATTAALEELFAHEAWLKRVASSLARHEADDLVQETWLAAMRRPPENDRPVRPWLARVARNLSRMRHRAEHRRAAREQAVVTEAAASPEALVEQLEAHRRLGGNDPGARRGPARRAAADLRRRFEFKRNRDPGWASPPGRCAGG
jgi:DNA-directed RNA polymerase specialized sigma24 family protein